MIPDKGDDNVLYYTFQQTVLIILDTHGEG